MNNAEPPQAARSALDDATRSVHDILNGPHLTVAERARLRATAVLQNAMALTDPRLPDNPIIYANSAFLELSGYPEEEIVGFNCRFLQGPLTDRAEVARLKEAIRQQEPIQVTLLNYRKDGTTFWNELTIAPVRDDVGALTHFVAVQTDVTALKALEAAAVERAEELQAVVDQAVERAEELQAVVDQAMDGVFLFDPVSKRLLKTNLALRKMLGYTEAQAAALTLYDIIAQPRGSVDRNVAALTRKGGVHLGERQYLRRDGSIAIVDVSGRVVRHDSGEAYCVVAHDLSERRREEGARRAAEEDYRALFDGAAEGIFQTSPAGRYLRANPALARIYGYGAAEDLMTGLTDIGGQLYVEPGRRAEFQRLMRDQGRVSGFESQVRRRDGTVVWISESAQAVYDASESLLRYEGFVEDITERKTVEAEREQAQEALRRSHDDLRQSDERLRLALASGGFGTWDYNIRTGQAENVSDQAKALFGLAPGLPASSADFLHVVLPEDRPLVIGAAARAIETRRSAEAEFRVTWPDGGAHWLRAHSRAIYDEAGEALGLIGVTLDITDRKQREAEQECALREAVERADRDPLTGLWNHRAFHARFDAEAARAEREGGALAVVMLDLNNFKFFNDAHGHVVGDGVLHLVAERLQQICRPYDTVARFGGDEFALLLPGVGSATADEVEARLRADLAGMTHHAAGHGSAIPITLSLGAALLTPLSLDRQETLRRADERLRRAKAGGDVETEADQVRLSARGAVEGFSMLDALVTAVDNKDRYTHRHSEDVLAYSLMIAREMGLDERTCRTVAVAALLHDVGKIGVPDSILRKPGELTEEEFRAVQQHPTMGAALVATEPGLADTVGAVRHHHERWDGGGYPSGLRGEQTPLIARLMAVADAYSAMTTDRPYRQGMQRGKALAILEAGAATQWDPECVSAFLAAMGKAVAGEDQAR